MFFSIFTYNFLPTVSKSLILKNLGDAQNIKKLKTETWSAVMNVTNGFTGMYFKYK